MVEMSAKDVNDLVRPLEHLPSPYTTLSYSHSARARTGYCINMIDRVTGILLR